MATTDPSPTTGAPTAPVGMDGRRATTSGEDDRSARDAAVTADPASLLEPLEGLQDGLAAALTVPGAREDRRTGTDGSEDAAESLGLLDELSDGASETSEYEIVDEPRRGRLPRGRVKARRVRRIVRYVSPWSVFKVSLLFYLCLWAIFSVAGVILWQVAQTSGTIGNFEDFLAKLFAEEEFTLDGRQMFRATALSGVIVVFAGTGFTVLMALLFNAISDITGGIRLTVLELESARREVRTEALARADARAARRSR